MTHFFGGYHRHGPSWQEPWKMGNLTLWLTQGCSMTTTTMRWCEWLPVLLLVCVTQHDGDQEWARYSPFSSSLWLYRKSLLVDSQMFQNQTKYCFNEFLTMIMNLESTLPWFVLNICIWCPSKDQLLTKRNKTDCPCSGRWCLAVRPKRGYPTRTKWLLHFLRELRLQCQPVQRGSQEVQKCRSCKHRAAVWQQWVQRAYKRVWSLPIRVEQWGSNNPGDGDGEGEEEQSWPQWRIPGLAIIISSDRLLQSFCLCVRFWFFQQSLTGFILFGYCGR